MEESKNAMSVFKDIANKILSGCKSVASAINRLINGDYKDSPMEVINNRKNTEKPDRNPNETVIVGSWRLKILDKSGQMVYNEQLLFNQRDPENPESDFCRPKIIGRYDKDYYESLDIPYTPKYDIDIKRVWNGSENVHRVHAYLEYNRISKELSIHKCPRDSEADNGLFDGDGNEITEMVIQNGTKIYLGPSIVLKFEHPGPIANAREEGKKKPSNTQIKKDENKTRQGNPSRIPGRGRNEHKN